MGTILQDVAGDIRQAQPFEFTDGFLQLIAAELSSSALPPPQQIAFKDTPLRPLYDALVSSKSPAVSRLWRGLNPDKYLSPELNSLIDQIKEGSEGGLIAAQRLMDEILKKAPSPHLMDATIDLIVKYADKINGKPFHPAVYLLMLLTEKLPQLIKSQKWGITETKNLLLKLPPLLQRASIETKLSDLFEALLQAETWDDDCTSYLIWLLIEQSDKQTFNLLQTISQIHQKGLLKPQHIKQMAGNPLTWPILSSLSAEQMGAGYWDQETTTTLLNTLNQPKIYFTQVYVFVGLVSQFFTIWQNKNFWTNAHTQHLGLQIKYALASRQTRSHQAMGRYLQSIEKAFKVRSEKHLVPLYLKAALIFSHEIKEAYKNIFDFLAQIEKPALFEPGAARGSWAFLAGGKWAGIEKARQLKLPVIDGFSLSVAAKPEATNISDALHNLEKRSGKKIGDPRNPLLLAVRSGAPISFPGQLATVTNVGMNEAVFETLKHQHGETFASDTYARFLSSYACAVHGIHKKEFAAITDSRDPVQTLKNYKEYISGNGINIPVDPTEQLYLAMKAVQASWENFADGAGRELMLPLVPTNRNADARPAAQRRADKIDLSGMMGTAITINEMKFGNLNADSGAGVATSRNVTNGKKEIMIDFKKQSQGEDLMTGGAHVSPQRDEMDPAIKEKLENALLLLEKEWGYAVQVEFCVENGNLFITQVKDLSAAPEVQYKIIADMLQEGIISAGDALNLKALLPTTISTVKVDQNQAPLTHASLTNRLSMSGQLAFSRAEVNALHARGQRALFVSARSRENDNDVLKSGDGVIDIWGLAHHAFDTLTQNGIGLAVYPQAEWASPDESALTLGDTIFSSGDELTITSDGQTFQGLYPTEEVPIESLVLGSALLAGQMLPLMAAKL